MLSIVSFAAKVYFKINRMLFSESKTAPFFVNYF